MHECPKTEEGPVNTMDSEKMAADSRHPNSPLAEVVFELRFPGETAIECRRHHIQDKIRTDYPNLFVPPVRNGGHPALEPYRFEREDRSAGVMISLNRFSYYCRAYPGFEKFKRECLRVTAIFNDIIKVDKLNRVGLRHTNIIPFSRENDILPLRDCFAFTGAFAALLDTQFEHLTGHLVFPLGSGKMTINLEIISNVHSNQEAFLLDLDYGKMENLKIGEIGNYLVEAHQESSDQFNRLISPNYYEYIRGREI
jgi:uncharacterized protein (TIGR04255 family)